jgi:hypothetical protein
LMAVAVDALYARKKERKNRNDIVAYVRGEVVPLIGEGTVEGS